MKKALYLSLTLVVVALQTGCNRVNPTISSPGLVTYNSVSAQSTSSTSSTNPALSASAVERNTAVSTQRANGKSTVVVDTTAEEDASFSNEDVSEEYSKSGRVAFRRGQDWE